MTEEHLHEFTRKHDETMARLELQEAKEKKNRLSIIVSLLGAIGVGSGGGLAYFQDDAEDQNVKTVVATHVALDDVWKADADDDIESLMEEQQKLRDAVMKLQFTVETLSDKHRGGRQLKADLAEIETLLEHVETKGRGKARRRTAPGADAVQQKVQELFVE